MKAIVHFIHNPCPPISGVHRRCLWMVQRLVEIGFDVTFSSSTAHTDQEWTQASREQLKKMGVSNVAIYERRIWSPFVNRITRLTTGSKPTNPVHQALDCSPDYRLWFRRLVDSEAPDLLLINHIWFDQMVDHTRWRGIHRVLETLDLMTVNAALRNRVEPLLRSREAGTLDDALYDEKFMSKTPEVDSSAECELCANFDTVISISNAEHQLLTSRLPNADIRLVPISEPPRPLRNEYREGVLLTMGPNQFNRQALGYFCERVWPIARRLNPSITATITGSVTPPCPIPEGIQLAGLVPDLAPFYSTARVSVSPVFVGTGQQVKIVEAMAAGLPVIALDVPTVSSLLIPGISGLIAQNASEMAEMLVALYGDSERCRAMGNQARELITNDWKESPQFRAAFREWC